MKTENSKLYYLGFSYCLGIGPMKFQALQSHFQNVKEAYKADRSELAKIIGPHWAEKFVEFRNRFDPIKELERLRKNGISVLAVATENYPESLKNISDPPICIYVKGDIDLLKTRQRIFFAIVGTRKPTSYGVQVAKKFAYELAAAGFVIVSGMAMGIDTIAHQAALDAGGKTVAVLGCGVSVIYPAVNRNLYENIIKSGGVVASEFPPDQMVLKGLFISRNRLISGLSKGVLIAEGGEFSGALITAKYAGIQGKDVFAVPAPINSDMSNAPNLLIKQGAKMVTSVEDIYEEFDMKISPRKKEDIRSKLNETEKLLYDLVEKGAQPADTLAIQMKKPISEILNILSVMEINGILEKNQENRYQVRI